MGKKASSSSQKGKEVEQPVIDLTEEDDELPAPGGAGGAPSGSSNHKKRKQAEQPVTSDSVIVVGSHTGVHAQAPGVGAALRHQGQPHDQHQHQHEAHRVQRFDEELGTQSVDVEGEELEAVVCYGAFSTAIVGIQYYNGIVSRKEQVRLVREPTNRYDRNAIRVDNIRGEQVGHIPRDAAVYLSPMLDKKILHHAAGVVTSGTQNKYRMPVALFLYGLPQHKADVVRRCQLGGLRVGVADSVSAAVMEDSAPNKMNESEREDALDSLFSRLEAEKKNTREMEPASIVTSPMYPHQKEALAWLVERENTNALPPFWTHKQGMYENILSSHKTRTRPAVCRGGILADDMGLGKTLEIIALIATNRPGAPEPVINVTPREDASGGGAGAGAAKKTKKTKKPSTAGAGGKRIEGVQDTMGETSTLPDAAGPGATLIVCPLSVLSNWETQIREHTDGSLSVYKYHGTGRVGDAAFLASQDVVITTYGTLAAEGTFGGLGKTRWLRVVLDEAHNIKNPHSQQAVAARGLTATRRWAISGTPIQNRLADVHSLLSFVRLQPLDDRAFWMRVVDKPVRLGDPRGYDRLVTVMSVMALRRTKDQKLPNGEPLLRLPSKRVFIQKVQLDPVDRARYGALLREAQRVIGGMIEDGTIFGNYATALEVILRLRQLCCHGSLVPDVPIGGDGARARASASEAPPTPEALERLLGVLRAGGVDDCSICLCAPMHNPVVTRCAHVFCKNCIVPALMMGNSSCPLCRQPVAQQDLIEAPPDEADNRAEGEGPGGDAGASGPPLLPPSSKVTAFLERLHADLRGLNNNNNNNNRRGVVKAVVFSQFVQFLDVIQAAANDAGFTTCRLTGGTSANGRERVIRSFQSHAPDSPEVIFVSLKAGGVGINLTAASRVYLLDPWWNPAVEEQAMDRVHRLGQTRDVEVVRFAAEDTIEERMMELQARKRELARAAFEKKTEAERQAMRKADLTLLLSIDTL